MHTFKRIIASVLTLAMLLSEIPTWALADMLEETEAPAVQMQAAGAEASEESTEATVPSTSEPELSGEEKTMTPAEDSTLPSENTGETVLSDEMAAEPEMTPGEDSGAVGSDENLETPEEDIGEAVDPSEDPQDALEWDLDGDGLLTITGTGDMGQTPWFESLDVITAVAIGEGVTGICEEAFAGFYNLRHVVLPDSLQSIGTRAFRDCVSLNQIYIPAGVTAIESGAFSGCTNLEWVSLYSYDVSIAEDAFAGVNAEVAVPRDISQSLFRNYGGSLEWMLYAMHTASGLYGTQRWALDENGSMELFGPGVMESQTSAAGYPWHQYANQIRFLRLRNLDNLADRAFAGCSFLTDLQLVNVDSVGAAAFSGCSGLSTIWLSDLTDIAGDAFTGVTAQVNIQQEDGWEESQMLDYGGDLTWNIILSGEYGGSIFWELVGSELNVYQMDSGSASPENGTSAADYPWYAYRDRIHTVVISSAPVLDYAFDGYPNLEMATLYQPPSVGAKAFRNCSALKNIYFQGAAPQTIAEDAFTSVTATVEYMEYNGWNQAQFQNYGGDLTWKAYVWHEPVQDAGTHGDNASWELGTGGTLTITGEGEMLAMEFAQDYPWYAYRDQIRMIRVEGLSSIADYAFAEGTTLSELEIGASVTKVGSKILAGTPAVEWVEFKGAPPAFAEDAFEGLSNATLLYPYSCKELWTEDVLQNYGGTDVWWSWLTQMLDGGMLGDVGYWNIQENYSMMFYAVNEGATFALPEMEADSYPWSQYAAQIVDISFEDITSIGADTFRNCTALKNVNFDAALTSIGSQAFGGCNSLEYITFWGHVDSIAADAFTGVTATVNFNAADWSEEERENYGGNLAWEETQFWLDGGMLGSINWNLYSNGELFLYAETETAMPSLASAQEYPWHGYREQITSISYNNVTSIGSYAFAGCTGLTEFLFDIYITALGNNIFEGCTNLKELTFHGDAPEFSENTFYGLTATVVSYPSAAPSWTEDKLRDYGGKITWPGEEEEEPDISGSCGENLSWNLDADGVLTISGTGAMSDFYDMVYDEENGWYYFATPWYAYGNQIRKVVLDTGVTSVGINAFAAYENLEEVYLSETVEHIADSAFIGGSLTTFVVAEDSPYYSAVDGVLFDGEQTALIYYPCGKPDNTYAVPEGVKRIADGIFNGACNLTEITIPSSVEEIGRISGAALTAIRVDPENENFCSVDGVLFSKHQTVLVHYPSSKVGTEFVIPDGVARIQMLAIHCDNLERATVPESVTYIGLNAFLGAEEITFMGDAPTFDVGEGSFCHPALPVTVRYPENNATWTEELRQSYGDHITWVPYSNDIASGTCGVDLTWRITEDGTMIISGTGEMFHYDTYMMRTEWYWDAVNVKRIVMEEGVTSVGDYAFYGDFANVTEISLPDSLVSIGSHSFEDCKNVTELTFGSNLESIGDSAFIYMELTGTLTLPDSLKSIGSDAFRGCSGLTAAELGSGLETIGDFAFTSCSGLTGTVTIPASISRIGQNVFIGCSGIEHIRFEAVDCPTIVDNSLGTLSGLKSVYVPAANFDSYAAFLANLPASVEVLTDNNAFPVTGLTVTATYSQTVVLSWNPHESGKAVSYTLFRDGVEAATVTDCTWADRALESGSYCYSVAANFADGSATEQSETVTGATVEPEISGITGYVEYAGIEKVAEGFSTLYISVPDKGNLAPLGDQQTRLVLYYSDGATDRSLGQAQLDPDKSTETTAVYRFEWDVSTLSDGEYTLIAVLWDVDFGGAQYNLPLTVDNTPPAKLQQLIVNGTEEDIQLSWTRATEYDTVGYCIYRAAEEDENFVQLAQIDGPAVLSYTDTTAEKEQIYRYYVVGVDIFGREGREYDTVGGSRITDTVKPRVTQLRPSSGSYLNGTVAFTVKAEDNVSVTKTKLEYSVDQGAAWTAVSAGENGYLLDTTVLEDGLIQVRAFAYDAADNESDAFVQSYAVDNTGPEQVTGVTYESTSVTMTLRWNNVEAQDIGWFRVEQKQVDGTYKVVADQVTALGVNLQGLSPDTQYVYRVTAFDILGNAGPVSDLCTAATAADTTAPVMVQILPNSGVFSSRIPLSATVRDDYSVASAALEYSLNGVTWTVLCTETYKAGAAVEKISGELDLSQIPEGLLYVRATAVDHAGNTNTESSFIQHMVDKTAPAVPSGVKASGYSGYVEIRWNADPDVSTYQIYRAETEDGPYTLLNENVANLNYFDRNVEDGATYYYKVSAKDAAGNVTAFSEVVSAAANADTQAPEVLSIAPVDGGILSGTYAEVSALVKDNSKLFSVLLEYGHNGDTYEILKQKRDIDSYGDTVSDRIPVEEFAHGDTVYLRVTAADYAGNICDPVLRTYTVDKQAPEIRAVSAVYRDDAVVLSWNGGAEEDLAGYRIYRRNAEGNSTLIGQIPGEPGLDAYTWTDDALPVSGGTFIYQIEAVDTAGNTATTSSSGLEAPSIEVPARTGPQALLTCDTVMTVGVEYIIDGSGSTDDGQILSYAYDFGDGCTASGKTAVHKYTEEGSYTLRLTVTDNDGQSHTIAKKIVVREASLVGTVKVRIVDEKGSPVPNAPVYFDLGEENQVIRGTDAYGYATFTAEAGRHTVGCVIMNNQWLPVKRDLIVKAGETTSVSMTLINKPIVEGTFEIKPMTLEEIEAAGIDLTDPENQYYVEVILHLQYDNAEIDTTIPGGALGGGTGGRIIFDPTGKYKPKKDDDDDPDPIIITIDDEDDDDDDEIRSWSIELIDKSEDPKLMILDIPIGVRSLKEMFDVRLHILNNASSEFSMLNNVIKLDTPSGLSVVTDAYMKSQQTAYVEEIKGQTQKTIEWVVRGDQPGEYTLGADYSGILSQFNEPLTARFEAQDPIQVYGMSGMKMTILYADELEKGTLYYNVMLTNEGETDIYKPSISTDDILIEMELYDQTGMLTAERETGKMIEAGFTVESLSTLPDILKVGDSLVMHYMCIDQSDYTHCEMKLKDEAVKYQKNYGFENVVIESRPLTYFTGVFSTSINPVEKADQSHTTAKGAYDQLVENSRYMCWALARDMIADNYLPSDLDELEWEVINGDGLKGKYKDVKQAQALILETLKLSSTVASEFQTDHAVKFLKNLKKILPAFPTEFLGISEKQREMLNKALIEVTNENCKELYYTKKPMTDLIISTWEWKCVENDVEFVGNQKAEKVLHKLYSDNNMEEFWEDLGVAADIAVRILESMEETVVDVDVYLKAQANINTHLFLLDTLILYTNTPEMEALYGKEDTWVVTDALTQVRRTIRDENIMGKLVDHILLNLAQEAQGEVVDWATDKLLDLAGASVSGIFTWLTKTLELTAKGLDLLMNISEQYTMADNVRFVSIMSEAAVLALEDEWETYASYGIREDAEEYMKLLALLVDLRALGESQVALYGKSFETDFTVGNLKLLKAVRAESDAEEATSWYQWRNIVEDRISRLRVQLLKNPLTTEVTGRKQPTVTFNYTTGETIQSFTSEYEYSLDNGTTWITCDGGPIAVERPKTMQELWVRRVNRQNTDMTETALLTVYGAVSLSSATIEVLKTEDGYRVNNLDSSKTYRITFSETPISYSYDMELENLVPEGSTSYQYSTEKICNYVYIRALANEKGFASEITRVPVTAEVKLNIRVTGEGFVSEVPEVWEYGSQVSVTATPAAKRAFAGWYRNGVKVSSELTYTFTIYSSMYLEARFLRTAEMPLPDASGEVDPDRGTVSATTEDGTVVTVSGVPESAYYMVVKTVTDAQTVEAVGQSLGDLGTPVRIYDIDLLDADKLPLAEEGKTVTLDYSGTLEDMILCGISGEETASILKYSVEGSRITFDTNGSVYYVLTKLPADREIAVDCNKFTLFPGDVAELTAQFLPVNTTGTTIEWSLAEGDAVYAVLKASGNTAQLTAQKATGARAVVVTASAADGSFPSTSVEIQVIPFVHQLEIWTEDENVTGKKISVDINREMMLELKALVAPAGAVQDLIWTSSNEEIAEVADGWLTFTGETGTVTITAETTDGSGKRASVSVMVVSLPQNLEMAEGSVTELVGGKSASFRAVDMDTGKTLTSTQIAWSLAEEEYAPYASITVSGSLTTRPVPEQMEIVIVGRVLGNEEIGVVEHTITLYPEATNVEIIWEDAAVNGQTILVDTENAEESALPSITLDAMVYPDDAMGDVTWKSSNTSVAEVVENGCVTVKWDDQKSAAKTGTVTITATAADGSKSAASVMLNFGVFVKDILIEAPELVLRSGEKMTLTAETIPAAPTKTGVTWSLKNPEDSDYATITAAGRLTAKTVYGDHTVIVVATAKDGSGVTEEMPVKIIPKTEGILTVYSGEKNVTKSTLEVDLNETDTVFLSAYTLGDELTEYGVTWSSSSTKIATVESDEFGNATVTMLKSGAATIKAVAADGRSATVILKGVKKVSDITVTTKTGDMTLASGKYMTLQAAVQPSDATVKTVLWSVAEEDAPYASITSGGKLTAAKDLMERRTITVIAKAKDGGAETEVAVELLPLAVSAGIFLDTDEPVTNITYVHDMAETDLLQLVAKVYPLEQAREDVTWKSSSSKIASIDENGLVTCLKAGTTTITATTNDGSKVKASFKLTVVKKMTELSLPRTAVIAAGKSLTMTKLDGYLVDPNATNKNLIWSMEGEGAAFATLSAAGVLKTQKITEPKTVIVTATAADGSETTASCEVTIHPATTKVQILHNGEVVTKILTLEVGESLDLDGSSLPVAAADAYTWKSSAVKNAQVDADGVVTALVGGKTVSISCVAADGSGKSAVVKIQTVRSVRELNLPAVAVIAGGKKLTMTPAIQPLDATNKKLNWSIKGDASGKLKISNGVLTTVAVTAPTTVTVVAETTDGSQLVSECQVTICPATTSVEIRKDGTAAPASMKMKAGETIKLDAVSLPEPAADQFLWTSSNEAAVRVNPDGTVTAVTAGKTVTVTCSAVDGTTKKDTVSITVE